MPPPLDFVSSIPVSAVYTTQPSLKRLASMCLFPSFTRSDRIRPFFTCANAYDLFHVSYKDFPITNFAGPSVIGDDLDDLCRLVVGNKNLDLNLRQEIDRILCASIEFGMSFLAPEALNLFDSHPLDPHFGERLFHLIQLERLHNRFDHLHKNTP